eukprot:CAMPEP_0119016144 /NCGR_PEP_ID=MMETSP1176-20130426/11839_1 /TAXON_ID=265551 /ORGANISM="Synedropsis recta cf, Strain CCMP1620" /LENGTH=168 /DNA_ID=CAMNT_0006969477 /DNA_START=5 /DNA_END=511 /DNA_ORIENTATION=-
MQSILLLSLLTITAHAFHHGIATSRPSSVSAFQRTTTKLSCICVNCKYVTSCAAYHFVEEKHEQPHISKDPSFEPRNGSPTIDVHMRPITGRELEEQKMQQEHKAEEEQASPAAGSGVLIGGTVYDMRPEVSLEYDVVKCEDFVEDIGAWVRNMPEEIRIANPDFVPP